MRWENIVFFTKIFTEDTMNAGRMLNYLPLLFIFLFLSVSPVTYSSPVIPGDDEYVPFADEMPSPVNGLEGIIRSIKYPDLARKAGLEGKVFVMALINERGGVDDVKVVRGIGAGCDEAAVEAVKKAKFTPGKQEGKNVKCKLSLSIVFKLK